MTSCRLCTSENRNPAVRPSVHGEMMAECRVCRTQFLVRLSEEFPQQEKMEALGQVAATVAHDFNNVLMAILGFCELLRVGFKPDDPGLADVLEVQRAAETGVDLTRQLMAFSRQESSASTVFDLGALVTDMQPMLRRLMPEDVTLVLNVEPVETHIKATRGGLEQIVLNLAVNARDAMPGGGTLTISTRAADAHEPASNIADAPMRRAPFVVLTVSDTGHGMTAEVKAQVLTPFFTTKPPGAGTGLGLATVQRIVADTGATIRIDSTVGRGTAFEVWFAQADGAHRAADLDVRAANPSTVAPVSNPPGQTVLVVDDAKGVRVLAGRMLERLGYTVLVAGDATEALTLFDQHASIDLLLTDVVMPGVSGPALATRLRARRPTLKAVYMSGYPDDVLSHYAADVDADITFLHKPFTADTLRRRMSTALAA